MTNTGIKDASTRGAPRAGRRYAPALWWSVLIVGLLLFGPPIPLPGLETESKLSTAVIAAVLYLLWSLPTFLRFVAFMARSAFPVLFLLGYTLFHLIYVALLGRPLAFLLEAQWLLYGLTAAHLAWNLMRCGQVKPFVGVLYVFSLLLAVLGVYTSFTGPIYEYGVGWVDARFGLGFGRALATLDSANGFGGVMAAFTLFIIFHAWKKSSLVGLPLGLLGGVATIMSLSKSAMLATGVALALSLFIFFILHRRFNAIRLSYYAIFCTMLVTVVTAVVVYLPALSQLILNDAAGRTKFGERVLHQYASSDWLEQALGLGFRSTAYVNPETKGWVTAHNSYISLLAELGPLGLLGILMLMMHSIYFGLRFKRIYVVAPIIVIAVHSATEGFIFGGVYVFALVLIAVLCTVNARRILESRI